jgi:hypothetical protein
MSSAFDLCLFLLNPFPRSDLETHSSAFACALCGFLLCVQKHLPEPYTLRVFAFDLTACAILAGILPIWFSARIEAANRKRFLRRWHPIQLAEHVGTQNSLCSPFWSKLLSIGGQ